MLILLDTAEVEKIKKYNRLYPIQGVTTNPSIIAKQGEEDWLNLLNKIRASIGQNKFLHVQILADKAEKMIKEAEYLVKNIDSNIYIKVPLTSQGLKAIKTLTELEINTTATAIFTSQQALLAARAGADFVAPYVNRIDNIAGEGTEVVAEITNLLKNYELETSVLAASFKNIDQVKKCCQIGAKAVTLNPNLVNELVEHPLTKAGIEEFQADWESVYSSDPLYKE